MANLSETDQFDSGVYQLETTDPALGGVNGIMNVPGKSLVNRTRFLLNRLLDGFLNFVSDSGTKNAITLAFPQPVPMLRDGMEINFRVAVENDGAVNVSLKNAGGAALPTLPLYGGDHVALSGGELPAGAGVRARLNTALNAANGGAWVIMSITGGYARVPTAPVGDMSTKVANMAALFQALNGLKTVDVSAAGDTVLETSQYGVGMMRLTGELSAPKKLLFPAQTGQWIIENKATGDYIVTAAVRGGAAAGVVLPVDSPVIVQSDGTTIKFASRQTSFGVFLGVQVFTSSGTYTPGTYNGVTATKAWVRAIGGGGPGGCVFNPEEKRGVIVGSGGGSGAYGELLVTSGLVTTPIAIGSGGAAKADNRGAVINEGGETSFGSLMICDGGVPGLSNDAALMGFSAAGTNKVPRVSGTGTILVNSAGALGGMGIILNDSLFTSGQGANSLWGQGGQQTGQGNGNRANGYGAGGGGGGMSSLNGQVASGGAGAPGLLLVFEYA